MDPDHSINKPKNLEKPLFQLVCDLLSLKTAVQMSLQLLSRYRTEQKKKKKNQFFVGFLKVFGTESGSVSECHGSGTLPSTMVFEPDFFFCC
jgi:hypothetical protein